MITHAANNAIDYLLTTRSPDGYWRDFWTPGGMSDAWVTGYVGAVLAASPSQRGSIAAQEAWSLLERARFSDEGWGYSPEVPVDSDSTAWILLLAERVGRGNDARALRARKLLRRHMVGGGISTYGQTQVDELRHYLLLPNKVDLSAWCLLPHTCVTAAVAGLSTFRSELTDYLLNAQQDDGSWHCYWWFEPAYATALAAKALAIAGEPRALKAVERAIAWAGLRVHTLRETPTPFELAWLLRILLLEGHLSTEAQRCLDLLLSLQDQNGAWRGTARLRVPPPYEPHPDSVEGWTRWLGPAVKLKTLEERLRHIFSIFSLDQRGIFTTATALAALQETANVF